MKKRKNEFEVISFEDDEIILEEDKQKLKPISWFFFRYGRLITTLVASISILTFIGAVTLTLSNLPQITPPDVLYPDDNEVNVIMEFKNGDNDIESSSLPITKEYAEKLFNNIINNEINLPNNVIDKIEVNNDKVLIFDDGSAVIIYENELPVYISNKNNIKIENDEITILEEAIKTVNKKELPDKTIIYEFENDKVLIEKNDNYYLIDKDDLVYDEDGNIKEDTINQNDLVLNEFTVTNNSLTEKLNYKIVIEETEDYSVYNAQRLLPQYIYYKISVDKNIQSSKLLNSNIWENNDRLQNTTYILYEGELEKSTKADFALALWVDYETIQNDMQNKSFIGTIKIYAWEED